MKHLYTTHSKHVAKQRTHGFTIMELLVAVFVAGLMVSLINFVFMDTSKAVKRGIAMANIISDSRAATTVLKRDADMMIGPRGVTNNGDTGNGVLMIIQHETEGLLRLPPSGAEETQSFRTDQLMFFRTRQNPDASLMMPLAPKTSASYSNDLISAGTPMECETVKIWYGHVLRTNEQGAPDTTVYPELLGNEPNQLANDWILGRQATFMVDTTTTPFDTGWVHASDATWLANILNSGGNPISNPTMVQGTTDMADQVLGHEDGSTPNSVIQDLNSDYFNNVLKYAYPRQRLYTNPTPLLDPNNGYALNAWQIAQMHPVFMTNVVDFAVEFAADTDGDGFIDRDGNFDGQIDPQNSNNGQIMWYGDVEFENWDKFTTGSDFNPNAAIVHPITSAGNSYMNRVYQRGNQVGDPENVTGLFVWRHDQPDDWPAYIRIRYRVVDPAGSIESGNRVTGVWFENVIRVNRAPL